MDTFLKLRHTDNHEYYGIKTAKITQKRYIHYILNYMMEKRRTAGLKIFRCEGSGGQEHEIRERYQFRWLFIAVCA